MDEVIKAENEYNESNSNEDAIFWLKQLVLEAKKKNMQGIALYTYHAEHLLKILDRPYNKQ